MSRRCGPQTERAPPGRSEYATLGGSVTGTTGRPGGRWQTRRACVETERSRGAVTNTGPPTRLYPLRRQANPRLGAGQIGDRPLELVAASGRGRLLSLGVEGPYPDVAVTSAADAALFGDDQVTLSTRVLIPPVSLPDAAHASLGATSDGARPPGHPSNILLELQVRQLNGGRIECMRRCKTRFIVSSMSRLQLRIERT